MRSPPSEPVPWHRNRWDSSVAEERQEYSREIALPTQIATPHKARRRSEKGRSAVAKKEQTTQSERTRERRALPWRVPRALLCVHDCCNQARALIELAASSPNPVAGRADFLLCQVLLMGLLRNRAMVSGWATLHKIGGSPRAISSASATTSFPIPLIAVSIAPA